ncbi:MAG: PIN domain-containing protein [Gemmatimonadota bacterium]|nr:PIN domain-containing protein [Gemmatimonadota bacterium]
MIYVDTSVALAHLFAEDRRPPASFWTETLVSSRLLEYEMWTRLHAREATAARAEAAQQVIARISLLELAPLVLARALDPFPVPVRTLDALHLASCQFLRGRGQHVELASYDDRMANAGRALGIPLRDLH